MRPTNVQHSKVFRPSTWPSRRLFTGRCVIQRIPVAQEGDLKEPNAAAIVYVRSHDGRQRGTSRNGISLVFAVDESLEDYLSRSAPSF